MPRSQEPSFQRRRTISAWVISVTTVILGTWVSIWGADIREASELFWSGRFSWLGLRPDGNAIGFYLVFLSWGGALLVRLLADDKREWTKRQQLMQAIHRVPNFDVIRYYPVEVRELIAVFSEPIEATGDDERMAALETRIKSVARSIALMARKYARREEVRYGANIMLVIRRNEAPEVVFKRLKFHDPANRDALQALLFTPRNLLFADVDQVDASGSQRFIPEITLPVPKEPSFGKRELLPGAPVALVSGELSVYENTYRLVEECEDFSKNVRDQVAEYFSENGEGKNIRSFAAFRIGDAESPIGVFNIDSEGEDVLGRDPEFYPTFRALVEPLLAVMAPFVREYGELLWKKIA